MRTINYNKYLIVLSWWANYSFQYILLEAIVALNFLPKLRTLFHEYDPFKKFPFEICIQDRFARPRDSIRGDFVSRTPCQHDTQVYPVIQWVTPRQHDTQVYPVGEFGFGRTTGNIDDKLGEV